MGITVLISSHILDELSNFATHYGFIDKGSIVSEISAEELESKCRKSVKVKVNDIKPLICYLDDKRIEYSVTSDDEEYIFANLNVTDFVTELSKLSCNVIAMSESDESLESYFINLVGGAE